MESKSFFSFGRNKAEKIVKLEPESLTDYYDDRKKLIFNEITLSKNEDYIFDLIKRSQSISEKKLIEIQVGFFSSTPVKVYGLSVALKENIANYCLVISLYLKENKKFNALKLFLFMCEKNKEFIEILVDKIITFFPRMSNRNKIRLYYPTIIKITLQIISVYIKLAGKFNKFNLESFYIQKYFKIIYGISNAHLNLYTNYEYNSRQYIFEKKYVYCNYLYCSSIYLFNRCRPLYLPISILQHILDIYNDYCKNESWLNESRMLFLLKLNYNLSLLYYTVGNNKEAINNLNKAKEILCKIKNFPVLKILKSDESILLSNRNRSNKNNFDEISTNNKHTNDINIENNNISLDKQDKVFASESNNFIKDNKYNINLYSTKYFGVNNILQYRNFFKLEIVKENILKEIELNLAEIELKNNNYTESLNHINYIINSQTNELIKNSLSNKDSSKKFIYNLTERDKKRILHILEEIEKSNLENQSIISKGKYVEEIKNMIDILKKLIGKN